MANEFRIKHGLIVTGSSYFSENMFGPNLPEETSPSYYITWRQSDGRFEASQVTPGSQANTVGCWDYITSGDVSAGKWRSFPDQSIGSGTTSISISNEDNGGNNQHSLLSNIGIGSVITLFIGANSTSFTITGVIPASTTANTAGTGVFNFSVSYLSGNQYSITGTPEMCLGIAAASPSTSTSYCIDYKMGANVSLAATTAGLGGFDRVVSGTHYTAPFGTVDNNVNSIFLNNTALQSVNGKAFFQGFVVGDFLSISYSNKITHYQVSHVGLGAANVLLNVNYNGGDLGYTIPTGDVFTICKSPGI